MLSIAFIDGTCCKLSVTVFLNCSMFAVRPILSRPCCFLVHISLSLKRVLNKGTPLGPLLFCNTVQPLLDSLQSVPTLGYLDYVSLGGSQNSVAADVSRIIESGQRLGLHLNASKCEMIASSETVISDPILQTFSFTPVAASVVLGAPLFLDRLWMAPGLTVVLKCLGRKRSSA